MAAQPRFLEQLERVRRWHQLFREVAEGRLHDRPSEFYQDIVYAYFMNCYHLKDWIRNDPASGPLAGKVERFISATPDLALCADLCNGLKHLAPNRRPRSAKSPRFGKRLFKVSLGTQPTTIAVDYTIETSSGPMYAFDLATRCLAAWEAFLAKTG
jgi:hypothetical protein